MLHMKILTRAFYETLENELNKSLVSLDENEVNNLKESMIQEIIPDLVKSIKKTLLSNAKKMLEERRKLFSEFCKRNVIAREGNSSLLRKETFRRKFFSCHPISLAKKLSKNLV